MNKSSGTYYNANYFERNQFQAIFFRNCLCHADFIAILFQHNRFHWFNAIFFFTPKSCCPRRSISILWKYRFVVVNAHVHSYPALDIGGKRTHKKEQQTSLDDYFQHSQNKYNYRKTIAAAYPWHVNSTTTESWIEIFR